MGRTPGSGPGNPGSSPGLPVRGHTSSEERPAVVPARDAVYRSDVAVTGEMFAKLIGSHYGNDVLLFEVQGQFVREEWSEPVQYRFVRSEGGLLTMEVRLVESN